MSLIAVGVLVGALLSWFGWQNAQANNPTFTAAEVLTLYQTPVSQPADRLTWDASAVAVRGAQSNSDDTAPTQPTGCSRLLMGDLATQGEDVISVELRPVDQRDSDEDYSRIAATFLYADPDSAHEEFMAASQTLKRCATFSTENVTVSVQDVHRDSDHHGASRLGYRLKFGNQTQAEVAGIDITQYGNCITWTLGAEIDTAGAPGSGSVNLQLVARL